MKNLSRKLLLSIFTVALAIVALGTSTFAWFTLGTTSEVSEIKINLQNSFGMEISLDQKKWGNEVSFDKETKDLVYVPVTTLDGKTFKKLHGGNTDTAADAGSYAELTLYARVTKEHANAQHAVRVNEVKAEKKTGTTWTSDVDIVSKGLLAGEKYLFDTLNATRISFAKGETVNRVVAIEDDAYAPIINFGAALTEESVWAGNAMYFTTNNQATAERVYFANTEELQDYMKGEDKVDAGDDLTLYTGTLSLPGTGSSWGAMATDATLAANLVKLYADQKGATIPETVGTLAYASNFDEVKVNVDYADNIDPENADIDIIQGTDFEEKAGDEQYNYATITIRVWVEGWDADCINSLIATATEIALDLELYKKGE